MVSATKQSSVSSLSYLLIIKKIIQVYFRRNPDIMIVINNMLTKGSNRIRGWKRLENFYQNNGYKDEVCKQYQKHFIIPIIQSHELERRTSDYTNIVIMLEMKYIFQLQFILQLSP